MLFTGECFERPKNVAVSKHMNTHASSGIGNIVRSELHNKKRFINRLIFTDSY